MVPLKQNQYELQIQLQDRIKVGLGPITFTLGKQQSASFKYRRIFWMTLLSIIAAMIRSVPC